MAGILIRLTDRRFVIVDGGFNRSDSASLLLKAMKEQSTGYLCREKITVAAWIITHAHGDHSGVLKHIGVPPLRSKSKFL